MEKKNEFGLLSYYTRSISAAPYGRTRREAVYTSANKSVCIRNLTRRSALSMLVFVSDFTAVHVI